VRTGVARFLNRPGTAGLRPRLELLPEIAARDASALAQMTVPADYHHLVSLAMAV